MKPPVTIDAPSLPLAASESPLVGLSEFISANIELIVDECEQFARTLGPAAADMDSEALRDHLDKILVFIAADMREPQSEFQRSEKSKGHAAVAPGGPDHAAETHGALRAASGFDVTQTAAEYRALRASVIRLWLASAPTLGAPQVEELTRFNEAMDQALAETLLQFASAAEASRNLFLGVLSHELRTPLGTVLGSADGLLLMANEHPELREVIHRIRRGGQRIRNILDDLLDFVHSSTRGGMRVHPVDIRMDALCTRVAAEVQAAFPGSRVQLEHVGDMQGRWDEHRIAQAVSNLMSNAIKYGVQDAPIQVALDGTAGDDVLVAVHNHGAEIPPGTLESLFQPLVRGQEGDPTGASLGLGLFIVREIALAHGGTVDVVSANGRTTFNLRLPRRGDAMHDSAIGQMRRT